MSGQAAADDRVVSRTRQLPGPANHRAEASTALEMQNHQHYYLTVLPRTDTTVELIQHTLAQVQAQGHELLKVIEIDPKQGEVVVATGYQFSRQQQDETSTTLWDEQLLLVHSDNYQRQQQRGLEQRLQRATDTLVSLTPSVGRGKRQIREESILITKAQAVLKQYRLDGMLHYTYECQTHPKTGLVRYQITSIVPQAQAIAQHQQLFGWRAYVTNAPLSRLSFADAVLTYRDEWIIERGFGRYKGKALSVSPLFVKRDDQVQGLLHLLSLGLRVLTLIEFVVRRRLQQSHQELSGLYPDKPKCTTSRPSAERLLKAFDNLTLTVFEVDNQVYGHVSPLSELQQQILSLLGLPTTIYSDLVDDSG